MIRLHDARLPARVRAVLSRWQREIDSLTEYEHRVAEAKRRWPSRNRSQNKTFREIRRVLTQMCSGARRCCYCEDSYADEVEHIRPKDLYPEQTYVWSNLLYACGPCNGPKNNKFAVFADADGALVDVARMRSAPGSAPVAIVEPISGAPVLLDPRAEDPMDFLELDLLGTFFIQPRAEEGSRDFERAVYTIDTLRLNRRDALVKARAEAFVSYRARLREYVFERDAGTSQRRLARLVRAVRDMQHPFVWAEMQRSGTRRADLRRLFEAAPESLTW